MVHTIVDIESREDFDSYMRNLEQRFYQKINVPAPPYQQVPEYPPKPFQTRRSKPNFHFLNLNNKEKSQIYDDQRKDYVDKINEANFRRS